AIGAAEADCLAAGSCRGLAPMPDEIAAMVGEAPSSGDSGNNGEATSTPENDEATSTADDDGTSTPASNGTHRPPPGSPGDVYKSPTYGYSVSYDPDVWTISNEDLTPDDPYDQITFESTYSFVSLI